MLQFSLSGDGAKTISTSTAVHGISDLSPPILFGERGICVGVPGASWIPPPDSRLADNGDRGGLVDGGRELGGRFSASDDWGEGDGVTCFVALVFLAALDCVDALDAFDALPFLPRAGFGAVVPAKLKKTHPGERR